SLAYLPCSLHSFLFFFTAPAPTDIYTLSLHDALPICHVFVIVISMSSMIGGGSFFALLLEPDIYRLGFQSFASNHVLTILIFVRSEEHTSELQSRFDLVCRLLLEKKKIYYTN